MRVLLIGSSGFLGRHLATELLSREIDVEGWSRSGNDRDPRVHSRRVDMLERASFLAERGPWDAAVLLAGHSVPGDAFDAEKRARNERIAAHALDHLARCSPGTRVIVLSSAHVYGRAPRARPVDETEAITPLGEYGRSKVAIENVARARARELDLVIARSFNQIGPGMPRGLLVPDLVARITRGDAPIEMRGPDVERDFLDARDGARALASLITTPCASGDVFHVCSGRPTRVSAVAKGLVARLRPDTKIVFPTGAITTLIGSSAKIESATGWSPRHALAQTLDWIADDVERTR